MAPSLCDSAFARKGVDALISYATNQDSNNDIQLIIHTEKKLGIKKDYIPRVIPLKHNKMSKVKDMRILLITKDPANKYRDVLTSNELTSDTFKEIISVKNLKRRFRGSKLTSLYKEFDMVVADFRVHHLLPALLGSRFYHSSKKTPYMVRINKEVKHKGAKMDETIDPVYLKAQLKSICRNTSYMPNEDNCINVKVGFVSTHTAKQILENIQDVIEFLSDKNMKPSGGVIKGSIKSLQVKTASSASIPIYQYNENKEKNIPNDRLVL